MPSGAIGSNRESSGAIGNHREQSEAIGSYREPSGAIGSHREPSGAIGSRDDPMTTAKRPGGSRSGTDNNVCLPITRPTWQRPPQCNQAAVRGARRPGIDTARTRREDNAREWTGLGGERRKSGTFSLSSLSAHIIVGSLIKKLN